MDRKLNILKIKETTRNIAVNANNCANCGGGSCNGGGGGGCHNKPIIHKS